MSQIRGNSNKKDKKLKFKNKKKMLQMKNGGNTS